MGKTTLSQALAHFTGMKHHRIQFTSDLLPSDLIGVSSEEIVILFRKSSRWVA
jgi:MoxR-like ATPase